LVAAEGLLWPSREIIKCSAAGVKRLNVYFVRFCESAIRNPQSAIRSHPVADQAKETHARWRYRIYRHGGPDEFSKGRRFGSDVSLIRGNHAASWPDGWCWAWDLDARRKIWGTEDDSEMRNETIIFFDQLGFGWVLDQAVLKQMNWKNVTDNFLSTNSLMKMIENILSENTKSWEVKAGWLKFR
jgi:hypothetical protein